MGSYYVKVASRSGLPCGQMFRNIQGYQDGIYTCTYLRSDGWGNRFTREGCGMTVEYNLQHRQIPNMVEYVARNHGEPIVRQAPTGSRHVPWKKVARSGWSVFGMTTLLCPELSEILNRDANSFCDVLRPWHCSSNITFMFLHILILCEVRSSWSVEPEKTNGAPLPQHTLRVYSSGEQAIGKRNDSERTWTRRKHDVADLREARENPLGNSLKDGLPYRSTVSWWASFAEPG